MTDVAAPCLSVKHEGKSFEEHINLLKARVPVLMLNVPIVSLLAHSFLFSSPSHVLT